MLRFEPWPMSSSGLPSASAHCTALSTSLASRGFRVSAMKAVLESRDIRKRNAAGVHVHAAKLGAAVQRRKHLARIEQAPVVERAFEPLLLIEVGLREHRRHQVAFLDAHAMSTGWHPCR